MPSRAKPPGHVAAPLILFGVLSVGLGVVAEIFGVPALFLHAVPLVVNDAGLVGP